MAQQILKYGKESQRETVLLLINQQDLPRLCKHIYAKHLLASVFKNVKKGEAFKLFKRFFESNFSSLVKDSENLLVLNALVNSLERRGLEFLQGHISAFVTSQKDIEEFVNKDLRENSSLLLLILPYFKVHWNYEKLSQESKENFLTFTLQSLHKCLQLNKEKEIVVLLLSRLFYDMNMKFKKTVLKEVFAQNFAQIYDLEPHFIFLLFSLMKKLSDPKIINITVLKNFRLNYNLFFENVNLSKLLLMLLRENFEERITKESIFHRTMLTDQIFP